MRPGALVLLAVLLVSPLAASAQSASEVALARDRFRIGVEAARSDRWSDALAAFAQAYSLDPRPETLLNLAGAQARTGRLVESAASYRRFLSSAPEALIASHGASARAALAEIEARTPHVRITTEGLGANDAIVVDATAVSRAVVGGELPLDPGAHVLGVTRDGRTVVEERIELAEREATRSVRLVAPPPPAPPVAASAATVSRTDLAIAPAATPARGTADDTSVLSSPWLWIAAGVVVALGVLATVWLASAEEDPFQGTFPPGTVDVR